MLSKMGILSTSEDGSFGDELEEQIRMLLDDERRNDLVMNRSDSAPPIVERGGDQEDYVDGFIRPEDEVRSHPAYRSYYHSNVNLNPRLPPPLPCTRPGLGFQQHGSLDLDHSIISRSENGDQNYLFPVQRGMRNLPSGNLQQQGSLDHGIISRSENVDQNYLFPVHSGMSNSGNHGPVMRNLPSGNFYASRNGFNYPDFLTAQMSALNVNENRSFPRSPVLSNREEPLGNLAQSRILSPNQLNGEESHGNLAQNRVMNASQLNREESHGNLAQNYALNSNQLSREESHGNLVHSRILNRNQLNREESHGSLANNRIRNPNQLNSQSPPAKLSLHFLEEFKNNSSKISYFHLSQIAGHVVEFSVDQYGSRFIQQKLETATVEEKNMVFFEAMPEALVLMTDVFGNYVIQKLFEVGLSSHRRDLLKLISSHVLSLSLQVYGCRVIQKIIEVADLEIKLQLAEELAGHVMVCVRDQNGNHVIQKCIERIPVDYVGFIVTPFFGQVANLSIHPYGCRVMQRILEHCKKPFIQIRFMDEILRAVKELAQDQYGNYVIQHVLVHGKQHERSKIIHELVDIIVEMSQQKFASNVVEKCLKHGSPSEHRLLVNQMLGSTEDNEPLQAMMKDQYGNYVVQKVLETSDKQLRDFILSRINIHLNNIKKLTYGKHIYARIEKLFLVGRGERMAVKSPNPTLPDRG